MTTIYITETTLIDHPDYQVLCGTPALSQIDAINYVEKQIEDQLIDYGEGTINDVKVDQVSLNQIKISHPECKLQSWWITSHTL